MVVMLDARSVETNRLQTKRLLLLILACSRGGLNRIRIILALKERPCNPYHLTLELGLDYKAIQHHLRILEQNNLIESVGKKYGNVYFVSKHLQDNLEAFDEIKTRLETNKLTSGQNHSLLP